MGPFSGSGPFRRNRVGEGASFRAFHLVILKAHVLGGPKDLCNCRRFMVVPRECTESFVRSPSAMP